MTFDDLRLLASGFQPSKLFLTALDLGVFDLLAPGPRSSDELAAALQLDLRATEIACNGLVALGLLELEDGGYRSAAAARHFLDSSRPEYRGSILRHLHATWEDWDVLAETWRSGKSLTARRDQHLPSTPEGVRNFILGMENMTRELAPQLAECLPLAGCQHILDLGGGPGNYALEFARREPTATVVHFDLPETSAVAREFLAGRNGASRITFREGNFLKTPLGDDYDLVWASQILHMLGEVELLQLLRRIAAATAPHGVLAVHDQFLETDRVSPRSAALFGVHMLVATKGGRTYSFEEMEGWLGEVGFTPQQRIDYGGGGRILLARKCEPVNG